MKSPRVLAAFAIFVCAQTACSFATAPTSDQDAISDAGIADAGPTQPSCPAGETLQQVGPQMLCCLYSPPFDDEPGGLECSSLTHHGSPCTAGATATQQDVSTLVAACVSTDCDGNPMTENYNFDVQVLWTPLVCEDGGFVETGFNSYQDVERTCDEVDSGSPSCGSALPDGGSLAVHREPVLVSSTCWGKEGNLAVDCYAGGF